MKVIARLSQGSFGFYGEKRRHDGEEFEIKDKSELGSWMEVVEAAPPTKKRGRPSKKDVSDAESDNVPPSEE